jgi:hypothetical protein
MKVLNVSQESAEAALVMLARHVPTTVELGRPLLASRADNDDVVMVLTDSAAWWVSEAQASRMMGIADGRVEFTVWQDGDEISRATGGD